MPDDTDDIARRALAIAAALGSADPGEKAAARRMDERGSPIFWRQVARLGIPPREEPGWLRFTRMVAELTPAAATGSIHDGERRLGAVLAEAGCSELRLARLIAARGNARLEALERAIRMIARQRPKLDVVDLARAALGRHGNRLARDYYAHLDRTPTQEVEDA
jgi:hypothetical protein